MIANRFNPLGVSGAKPTPAMRYIQDGLLHMWDGIENVGYGQHDSGATYWKDLVSGNDLLPYGDATPPVWDDFGFCGENNIDHTLISTNPLSGHTEGTFEAVVQVSDWNQWVVANRGSMGGTKAFQVNYYGGSFVNIFPSSGGYKNEAYPLKQLANVAFSCNGDSYSYYVNGVLVSQVSGDFSASIFNNKPLQVGSAIYWHSSMFRMRTGSFVRASRISNRVLSADEIAFNFAIDKERFGI